MLLNVLHDKKGSKHKSKLLGRGIGTGHGKTSCRGGKGQTARTGVAINGFEGGQTPIYRRLPKRGFNNFTSVKYEIINLGTIERLAASGKIDSSSVITLGMLKLLGVYRGKQKLKLLATGVSTKVSKTFHIEAHSASKKAVELLSQGGGVLQLV